MDRRDQEALTEGAAHSPATDLRNQLRLEIWHSVVCPFPFCVSLCFSVPMKVKRTRPTSPVENIDGRDEILGDDERVVASDGEAERTVSDLLVPVETEGVVAESNARRVLMDPRVLEHRRAGVLLKTMKLLVDEGSKRAALPPLTALEDSVVSSNLRLRTLATACGLKPLRGLRRRPLLRLLGTFIDGTFYCGA